MSKMKKIYILGVMCLVILFTALLDVPKGTVEKVSANEPIINEGNVSRTAQLLGDANETIYRTFTATQKGEWIYPEDFGGTWVKNEKLYLALARNDHDTIEKYTTILSGHEDYTEIVFVEKSFRDLLDLASEIGERLVTEGCHLVCHYPDAESNSVVVEVDEESYSYAKEYLNKSGVENDVILKIGQPCVPFTTLRGGDAITKYQDPASYAITLGIGGSINGEKYVVTCGHSLNSVYTQYSHPLNAPFGYVTNISFPALGGTSTGDYGLIKVYSGNTVQGSVWCFGDNESISPLYSYYLGVSPGLNIGRYGRVSIYGTGTITAIDVTQYYGEYPYNTVTGMVKATVTSTPGQPGDSGGTITRINSGYSGFQGVFSGGNANTVIFTPYNVIYYATGFIPATGGN